VSDEAARRAVLDRLQTRLAAVDDVRRLAEKRGDVSRLARLDVLARILDHEIKLEAEDPVPAPGREDEIVLVGGKYHGMIVTGAPHGAYHIDLFGSRYVQDPNQGQGQYPRRFLLTRQIVEE
jgi:hypothetical protein